MALKADNPVEQYQKFKQTTDTADNGERVDDLPNKDWLRNA